MCSDDNKDTAFYTIHNEGKHKDYLTFLLHLTIFNYRILSLNLP